jgi:hypothetical protein
MKRKETTLLAGYIMIMPFKAYLLGYSSKLRAKATGNIFPELSTMVFCGIGSMG